jgi:hypothetical protein
MNESTLTEKELQLFQLIDHDEEMIDFAIRRIIGEQLLRECERKSKFYLVKC